MAIPKKKIPRGRNGGRKPLPKGESLKRLLLTGEPETVEVIPPMERHATAMMIAKDLADLIVINNMGILDAAKCLPISYHKLALLREEYPDAGALINSAIHTRSENRQDMAFNSAFSSAFKAVEIANEMIKNPEVSDMLKIEGMTKVASTLSLVAARLANAGARNLLTVKVQNNIGQTQVENSQPSHTQVTEISSALAGELAKLK